MRDEQIIMLQAQEAEDELAIDQLTEDGVCLFTCMHTCSRSNKKITP